MKRYREAMNELQFSPQHKQAMIDRLLSETERPSKGQTIPLRRLCALGAAAALAATLCLGAAASGALTPAAQAFAAVFGGAAAQTEIIDRIGYPLDASDTVDGVTVQADAIIGDTYSYAIVYSIFRENGQPLAENLLPNDEGALPLRFDQFDTDVGHMGGMHGTAYFFDEDPSDNAVQFVELFTADSPLKPGTASVQLKDLSLRSDDKLQPLAEGVWKMQFDFAFEDSSTVLVGEQSFTANGTDAILNSVFISPLSFRIDYSVNAPVQQSDEEGAAPSLQALNITLTLTDGTQLDLSNSGGGLQPEETAVHCEKSGVFDRIIPLDTMESITIGDLTLPVNSQ